MNVITYGTFDLFHYGHLRLLQRAKEGNRHLTVAVSTDEFNGIKGKECVIPFVERFEIIRSLDCVDIVIPECSWEQKTQDIVCYDIDLLIMGSDWKDEFDRVDCQVIYLPRTEGISTTQLKEKIYGRKR